MSRIERAEPLTGETGCGPLGAHVSGPLTRFAVLAPAARTCLVQLWSGRRKRPITCAMERGPEGRFECVAERAGHGTLYQFVLDGRELPDPYARFLPEGVHGRAMVIESRYRWRHENSVRPLREHVIYELHVGTFTREGTYDAARARLRTLAQLGVTAIELMPVAAFAGERGWGYDGVALFAPHAPYGTPDALRRLVDAAHELGLAVLLDVVYNHFGPAGNYLPAYSADYFTSEFKTPWGHAPNFAYAPMRAYVLQNAHYWLTEFRFDGLRVDACHAIFDRSESPILRELALQVSQLEPRRLLIAEDDRNDSGCITRTGFDAVWTDDFHHCVRVSLTGERDGYYAAYAPGAEGIARTIEQGWLYDGRYCALRGAPRGTPARELGAERFVYCIQNHDQIGNRALGDRLGASVPVEAYCAVSALLLFLPMTPLLFMGQEWAASTPFLYFSDHEASLGEAVTRGRRREFAAFESFRDPGARARIPDPQAPATFDRSRLIWQEREKPAHARVLALYRALLALRRADPVLRGAGRERLRARAQGELLVVVNQLGSALRCLLVNFGEAPVALTELELPMTAWTSLLSSTDTDTAPALLGRYGFALLAGREQRTGS